MWRRSPASGGAVLLPGAAHRITLAGGRAPCLTSSLCNQPWMVRAPAAALRSAPSRRPSLQPRHRTRAGACKCLKAEAFSELTRTSLQSSFSLGSWHAVDLGCAPYRPGEPRDTVASSRYGTDSMQRGTAPGCRDSRHQSASAAVATVGDVGAGTRQRSNSVGLEFVGGEERGCRMLRTAAEFDSSRAPGKVTARGQQVDVAFGAFNPKWTART